MIKDLNLYFAKKNRRFIIITLNDNALLKSVGIKRNAIIEKVSRFYFGGPVLIRTCSSLFAISKEIACQIVVREIG